MMGSKDSCLSSTPFSFGPHGIVLKASLSSPVSLSVHADMHHLYAGTLEQFHAVCDTVHADKHHAFYARLYYELGTFDTRRVRDIQRRAVTVVVRACQFRYGVGLGVQDIGLRDVVLVLADILETGWRAVVSVGDYALVFHYKASYLPSLAIGILRPNLRHAEVSLVKKQLF